MYLKEVIDANVSKTKTQYTAILARYKKHHANYQSENRDTLKILDTLIKESQDATKSDSNHLIVDVAREVALRKVNIQNYAMPKVPPFICGSDPEEIIQAAFGFIKETKVNEKTSTSLESKGAIPKSCSAIVRNEDSKPVQSSKTTTKLTQSKETVLSRPEQTSRKQTDVKRELMTKPEVLHLSKDLYTFPISLVLLQDGTLILCHGSYKLSIIDATESITVIDCDFVMWNLAIHPFSDQLFGVHYKRTDVRSMNHRTGTTQKLFDIEENPQCIAVSQKNNFLIGQRKSHKMHVYSTTGVKLQTIDCIGEPYNVSVSQETGRIGVAFCLKGMTVLDESFKQLYATRTRSDDVEFDNYGHIIVGDNGKSNCVHIFHAETGQMLLKIPTEIFPGKVLSLVAQNGKLFVGTEDANILVSIKYLQ